MLQVRGACYLISYDGWSSSWDEWVDATRLRSREKAASGAANEPKASSGADTNNRQTGSAAANFAVGDAVQIEWKGTWYPGRILKVDAGRYRITCEGWSSSWDE